MVFLPGNATLLPTRTLVRRSLLALLLLRRPAQ
jgi:hypothetical protein